MILPVVVTHIKFVMEVVKHFVELKPIQLIANLKIDQTIKLKLTIVIKEQFLAVSY